MTKKSENEIWRGWDEPLTTDGWHCTQRVLATHSSIFPRHPFRTGQMNSLKILRPHSCRQTSRKQTSVDFEVFLEGFCPREIQNQRDATNFLALTKTEISDSRRQDRREFERHLSRTAHYVTARWLKPGKTCADVILVELPVEPKLINAYAFKILAFPASRMKWWHTKCTYFRKLSVRKFCIFRFSLCHFVASSPTQKRRTFFCSLCFWNWLHINFFVQSFLKTIFSQLAGSLRFCLSLTGSLRFCFSCAREGNASLSVVINEITTKTWWHGSAFFLSWINL